jgi:hypothetical protein
MYLDDTESFESAFGLGLGPMLECSVLNLVRSIIETRGNCLPQIRVRPGQAPEDMHQDGLNRYRLGQKRFDFLLMVHWIPPSQETDFHYLAGGRPFCDRARRDIT